MATTLNSNPLSLHARKNLPTPYSSVLQVPPAELEGLLLTHPAVQDAGVVGVPDLGAGELPRAYIVLKPNMTASAEDICKFVEGRAFGGGGILGLGGNNMTDPFRVLGPLGLLT